jgi:hypothetical protein
MECSCAYADTSKTAATETIHSGQEHIGLALLKDDLVTGSLVSIVDRHNRRVSAR